MGMPSLLAEPEHARSLFVWERSKEDSKLPSSRHMDGKNQATFPTLLRAPSCGSRSPDRRLIRLSTCIQRLENSPHFISDSENSTVVTMDVLLRHVVDIISSSHSSWTGREYIDYDVRCRLCAHGLLRARQNERLSRHTQCIAGLPVPNMLPTAWNLLPSQFTIMDIFKWLDGSWSSTTSLLQPNPSDDTDPLPCNGSSPMQWIFSHATPHPLEPVRLPRVLLYVGTALVRLGMRDGTGWRSATFQVFRSSPVFLPTDSL
ncbi:uncharacterized protein EI97DRAFT_21437 [Westerdykella ornata]|uniref:Uncharacterized protein n=1 Tax=Westerdykella ornata TaxID=318751 RepID=A0A6A6JX12_WESOR|nr:uncharacterized protein EI97DRAFT_21437 [Westerdykella ornata]KAF2281151.1 hypothetical protein EI97DRAFT_21437 [Westerdykella ornata]